MEKPDLKKVHKMALKRFKRAFDAEDRERDKMREDLRFARGETEDQWEANALKERGNARPALTINRMGAFEKQIMGDIRQNSPSIKIIPVGTEDKQRADILQGVVRHIQNNSTARQAYVTAATSTVRCGKGVFKICTEYSDDNSFEQDVKIKRIRNPFTVFFDPDAEELTKADGKFAFESRLLNEEEFEDKYPNAEKIDWQQMDRSQISYWREENKVRVVSYWVKEPFTKTIGQLRTGETIDMIGDSAMGLYDVVKTRKVQGHRVVEYKLNGQEVIDGPNEFPSRYIPLIPVYGDEHHIDGETSYKGIVRDAKDAQRMYNLWRTTGMETISDQPRAPWVLTTQQIKGHEQRWRLANKTNQPYLLYNPDSNSPPPMRQPPPQPPAAMWQEAQILQDDMKAIIGIYDAGLGARSNETAGVAIRARQKESDVGNYHFQDNLTLSIEHAGKILVDVIPKIYDTKRQARILGEDGVKDESVEINSYQGADNDITVGKYDVLARSGPSYSTRREEMANFLIEMMRINPKIADVASDLIVKNMDLAGADELAERLQKVMPPGIIKPDKDTEEGQAQIQASQQQQQLSDVIQKLQLQGMQLDLEKKAADIDETQSKELKNQVSAEKDLAEIQAAIAPFVQQLIVQTLGEMLEPTAGMSGSPAPGNMEQM